jgi:hypothetical protein
LGRLHQGKLKGNKHWEFLVDLQAQMRAFDFTDIKTYKDDLDTRFGAPSAGTRRKRGRNVDQHGLATGIKLPGHATAPRWVCSVCSLERAQEDSAEGPGSSGDVMEAEENIGPAKKKPALHRTSVYCPGCKRAMCNGCFAKVAQHNLDGKVALADSVKQGTGVSKYMDELAQYKKSMRYNTVECFSHQLFSFSSYP